MNKCVIYCLLLLGLTGLIGYQFYVLKNYVGVGKAAGFRRTKPYHYELYLSKSNDNLKIPIIGLFKKHDGTFNGLKKEGRGEDGDISIKKSENGDAFVTAKDLYEAAASQRPSNDVWVNTYPTPRIKIQLSPKLVSALRDKTVLSELYIVTQERQD